jgi:hypothetical protein
MRRRSIHGTWSIKRKAGFLSLVLIFLFLGTGFPKITKGEASDSTFRVDASTSLGAFNNMAPGVNFWGQNEAQQRFIDDVGTDLYRIKVRLHKVKKVGDSYTNFPFEGDDASEGLHFPDGEKPRVMVQIYGIPQWLSTSKDKRLFSNNLPNYAKYPPQDFEEWAKIVSDAISRLKDLGLEKIDYYEIFGEPNIGSTWYQQTMNGEPNELGHKTAEVLQNFYTIYEYTALGIQAVDPNAKIGGVGIMSDLNGIWWTRFLCQAIKTRNMPLDFYSWHTFRTEERLAGFLALPSLTEEMVRAHFEPRFEHQGFDSNQIDSMIRDVYGYLKAFEEQGQEAIKRPYSFHSTLLKEALREEGFGDIELFLTEWNLKCPLDIRHDTHYGASFVIRGLIDLTDSHTEAQAFYCLSIPEDWPSASMRGNMSLFVGSIPKASFNAFRAFAMLGDDNERIDVPSSGENIYSIATKDQNSISLLATYYVMDEHPEYLPSSAKEVTIGIKNIPFDMYHYEIYLIDRNHSNGFYGSGPELEMIGQGIGSSDFEISGYLGIYGVVLIKLNRV